MHLSPAAGNALFRFLSCFCFLVCIFFACLPAFLLLLARQQRQIRQRAKSIAKSLQCVVVAGVQMNIFVALFGLYVFLFSSLFSRHFVFVFFSPQFIVCPLSCSLLRRLFCIVCSPNHCARRNGSLTIPLGSIRRASERDKQYLPIPSTHISSLPSHHSPPCPFEGLRQALQLCHACTHVVSVFPAAGFAIFSCYLFSLSSTLFRFPYAFLLSLFSSSQKKSK